MKPSIYNPTTLLPHDLGTHNDVNISNPQDGDVLTYDDAASEWVNSPFSWGSITGTLSAQTDLQSALDGKASVGSLTTNALPRWDGSALVNSGLSDDGTNLTVTRMLDMSSSTAPSASQFGCGRSSFTWVFNVPTGDDYQWRVAGNQQALLTSTGLGLGNLNPARRIESRDTANPQQRWSYSDTVYVERQVYSGGGTIDTTTGNEWAFLLNSSVTGLSLTGDSGFLRLRNRGGNALVLLSGSGSTVLTVGSVAQLGFFGRTPASSQALLAPLVDSTGGTPATTIAAVSGSGDDTGINNALASLVARITSLESKLVATTLVTQAA